MHNLTEYSDNCSKTCGSLWHYYRDERFLDNGAISDIPAANNNSALFKFKTKIAGRTGNDGAKNVKIRVPLKYLSSFWRTLEMSLTNREINLILSWSNRCFIIDNPIDNHELTFTISDTKLYFPVVSSSTQDDAKLLEQSKSGFKRTINWNKYKPKVTVEQQNQYLDFLINPSFQGVNRLFVLSFEDNDGRSSYKGYYLPFAEIKCYNVVIDERKFFDQPVKNNLVTFDNIQKIATGQGDDYTTGCLLDYDYYKMIAIDLSTQQALDIDPKTIQQINFAENLDRKGNTTMFFVIEEAKEIILDFSQGNVKVL